MTDKHSNDKKRKLRLAKIKQAVERLETAVFQSDAAQRSGRFRALYYLERLAKKAG